MKKNIIGVIVVLAVVGIGICGYFSLSKKVDQPKDVLKEVNTALINKTELIVFLYDSSDKKCDKCEKIIKELKDENIKYYTFDKNLAKGKEYKDIIEKLKINIKDFDYPALIYVKDGLMYANIININDIDNVKLFIKQYELNKVK